MMTSWTNNEHTAKRPTAAMPGVCLAGPFVNRYDGRLGQTSIDSRYIRH
ncbi:MAG TPA: hypothetical protein VGO68_18725 [Pyrinomonadaceae bacterium]|nr:hypothetical protein [Pyrinomonadaceae bacterium]